LDKVNGTFGFAPGLGFSANPTKRQLIASIFFPFSNLIERQDITSPFVVSSAK
jgi:hypothetical protein